MWNTNNKDLVEYYQHHGNMPSDGEYGEYLMRELMTLGYRVRKLNMAGGNNFVIALDLLQNDARVIFFCKTAKATIDAQTANSLMALRSMYKATKHIVVTNRAFVDEAKRTAAQNNILLIEDFNIGAEIVDLLCESDIMPDSLGRQLLIYKRDADERARIRAEEIERLRAEEEAKRKKEYEADEIAEMSPFEKYQAGLYDPRLPEAIASVSTMDVVSIGGLARRMKVEQDAAKIMLQQLAELGVVGPAQHSKPREVLMTQGMIEKRFGIRVRPGLGGLR